MLHRPSGCAVKGGYLIRLYPSAARVTCPQNSWWHEILRTLVFIHKFCLNYSWDQSTFFSGKHLKLSYLFMLEVLYIQTGEIVDSNNSFSKIQYDMHNLILKTFIEAFKSLCLCFIYFKTAVFPQRVFMFLVLGNGQWAYELLDLTSSPSWFSKWCLF